VVEAVVVVVGGGEGGGSFVGRSCLLVCFVSATVEIISQVTFHTLNMQYSTGLVCVSTLNYWSVQHTPVYSVNVVFLSK
jgi:hypothetical protein